MTQPIGFLLPPGEGQDAEKVFSLLPPGEGQDEGIIKNT
jgi:hypothetical protein